MKYLLFIISVYENDRTFSPEAIIMDEIKCPKCGAIIQMDETNYERVASQIRDAEFHRALEER